MAVCGVLAARRQRLPGLGAGDPQAAPGALAPGRVDPPHGRRAGSRGPGGQPGGRGGVGDRNVPGRRSGDRRVRGDRVRSTTLVTGSDKPHESASESQLSALSDIVAHPPDPTEAGGFYVSSQVRRPTGPSRRPGGFRACRTADARLRGRAPPPGSRSAGSRSSPPAAPATELAAGKRQRAMGIVAATTLGRVWLMATAILLAGLLAEREDGLAAALLLARPLHRLLRRRRASPTSSSPKRGGPRSEQRPGHRRREGSRREERRRPQHQSQGPDRARRLPRDRDPDRADLRQLRQKRSVPAPERVQARTVDLDRTRRHRPEHQQGGPLPGPRQRPDDRHDGLDLAPDGAEAEPRPDGDRGRLRPDQKQRSPAATSTRQDGGPLVPLPRRRSSSGSGSRT